MSETFGDYSQVVTVTELDGALRSAGATGVWHYVHGNNALRIENPAVVKAMTSLGWKQGGIDVPTLDQVDGAAAAAAMAACGLGPGHRIALDIEPDEFKAAPDAWPAKADMWCDQVRAAGYSPVVYGTDVTVAACGNHADAIWRAEPGDCDPVGPGIGGLAGDFFAGRRANQCVSGTYNGVDMDLSVSQFTMEGAMSVTDDLVVRVNREVGYDNNGALTQGGVADTLLGMGHALTGAVSHLTDMVASLTPTTDAGKLDAIKAELDGVQTAIAAVRAKTDRDLG